jgi:hypothetical protein
LPFIKQSLNYALPISAAEKIRLSSLLRDCWSACLRDQCWPTDYYKLRLYRAGRRNLAPSFFHERMVLRLLKALNDNETAFLLDDKLEFASACAKHGLPHVDTIAEFSNGAPAFPPGDLPEQSLFVKHAHSLGGAGVDRWSFDEQLRVYRHDGGDALSAAALIVRVGEMSAGRAQPTCRSAAAEQHPSGIYIVQRELQNHELMRPFSNGALCTIRVLTACAYKGAPQVIAASLRMPTGTSAVDNFAAGGIASSIDLLTGMLGSALSRDPRAPEYIEHPDSGLPIAGEFVPFWNEVLDLSLRAHRCFPDVASVGWDVVITKEGLKLLEANPTWGTFVVQAPQGKPLGQTALPALLMSHVETLEGEGARDRR